MLLRSEMTMNCAFVAFSRRNPPMSDTLRQSRAASISSNCQHGVGLYAWSAKISESEARVFSPPESIDTAFQLFLAGRTENEMPSVNGSSESTSSSSASPPRVSSW
eukprot:Amastigsp_a204394_2.p2 type:complete len:106 gc:universal Amastigsp_a204394_2:43-360(+)